MREALSWHLKIGGAVVVNMNGASWVATFTGEASYYKGFV